MFTKEMAYEAGARRAREYKVGDDFLGANPEFEKTGIEAEHRGAYVDGFLDFLPRPLYVERPAGLKIVGLGPPSSGR